MTNVTALRRKPKFRVVDEPSLDELREASAKAGRHICDEMRAYIASRDWNDCHIRADRSPPLHWFDRVRRTWR